MKRLKITLLAVGMLVSTAAAPAHAIKLIDCTGINANSRICEAAKNPDENATSMVKKIINLLLYVLGITAVVMIIWGGVKYVTSRGDATNVKSAKDTVTYAVVGLIVALAAYAIVNFVVTNFK